MIAVVVKIRPADNARGRRIAARVAGVQSVSGRRLGVSAAWDHAMEFLGNAKAIVSDVCDRLNPSLSVVGGSDLAPGKRV